MLDGVALRCRAGAALRARILPKQIPDDLVVNLHERGLQGPLPALQPHLFRGREDLPKRARDEAPRARLATTLHGEGLAGASLSIGEDADLVAVQGGLHQAGDLGEEVLLGGRRAEDLVEAEVVRLGAVAQRELVVLGQHEGAACILSARPDAAHHADVAAQLLDGVVQVPSAAFRKRELLLQPPDARLMRVDVDLPRPNLHLRKVHLLRELVDGDAEICDRLHLRRVAGAVVLPVAVELKLDLALAAGQPLRALAHGREFRRGCREVLARGGELGRGGIELLLLLLQARLLLCHRIPQALALNLVALHLLMQLRAPLLAGREFPLQVLERRPLLGHDVQQRPVLALQRRFGDGLAVPGATLRRLLALKPPDSVAGFEDFLLQPLLLRVEAVAGRGQVLAQGFGLECRSFELGPELLIASAGGGGGSLELDPGVRGGRLKLRGQLLDLRGKLLLTPLRARDSIAQLAGGLRNEFALALLGTRVELRELGGEVRLHLLLPGGMVCLEQLLLRLALGHHLLLLGFALLPHLPLQPLGLCRRPLQLGPKISLELRLLRLQLRYLLSVRRLCLDPLPHVHGAGLVLLALQLRHLELVLGLQGLLPRPKVGERPLELGRLLRGQSREFRRPLGHKASLHLGRGLLEVLREAVGGVDLALQQLRGLRELPLEVLLGVLKLPVHLLQGLRVQLLRLPVPLGHGALLHQLLLLPCLLGFQDMVPQELHLFEVQRPLARKLFLEEPRLPRDLLVHACEVPADLRLVQRHGVAQSRLALQPLAQGFLQRPDDILELLDLVLEVVAAGARFEPDQGLRGLGVAELGIAEGEEVQRRRGLPGAGHRGGGGGRSGAHGPRCVAALGVAQEGGNGDTRRHPRGVHPHRSRSSRGRFLLGRRALGTAAAPGGALLEAEAGAVAVARCGGVGLARPDVFVVGRSLEDVGHERRGGANRNQSVSCNGLKIKNY
mmetsp:Transcript_12652/g.44776  ORF Transcript_12652/g.44776 Transcript_12652/m.44776 type:complete len:956 (-) Transcript_12652:67-2934(-)